jgi:hypothetical protein
LPRDLLGHLVHRLLHTLLLGYLL